MQLINTLLDSDPYFANIVSHKASDTQVEILAKAFPNTQFAFLRPCPEIPLNLSFTPSYEEAHARVHCLVLTTYDCVANERINIQIYVNDKISMDAYYSQEDVRNKNSKIVTFNSVGNFFDYIQKCFHLIKKTDIPTPAILVTQPSF